jgi:three-Cys-motif partner protein
MPKKDHHDKPFDKGTIVKLEIFEDYAEAWIPTFVMQSTPVIHIFDFFSGPGFDKEGVPGSPIRLLQKIETYTGPIFQKKTKIKLYLNEFEPDRIKQPKFEELKSNCEKFIQDRPKFRHFLEVKYYNENAESLFFKLLPEIALAPSLVYLDQNGVNFISKAFVLELEKLDKTDFIYFVSSSFFKRFWATEEFRKILDFDISELEKEAYRNMHRLVLRKLKDSLPSGTNLKLFPFTLKKGSNIYGIIFGAKHPRAVDKFLAIAWERNKINGEADFDIDDDTNKKIQPDLFTGLRMTKIQKFQEDLESKILDGTLTNNLEVIIFTYENGHIPKHATDLIKKINGSKISYIGRTPGVTYENAFKNKNIIQYTLIK